MSCRLYLLASLALFGGCERETRGDRIDALIDRLAADDRVDRLNAASALGLIRGGERLWPWEGYGLGPLPLEPDVERAVRALTRVVRNDEDGTVRDDAASALAQLRPPGPHPALVECAAFDEDATSNCEWALMVIADPVDLTAMADLVGVDRRGATRLPETKERMVMFHFSVLGERALPYLERMVRADREYWSVVTALIDLGEIRTVAAEDIVALALEDPHPMHRVHAIGQLCQKKVYTSPRCAPVAMRLLGDADEEVRRTAADRLGIPLPPKDVPFLPLRAGGL